MNGKLKAGSLKDHIRKCLAKKSVSKRELLVLIESLYDLVLTLDQENGPDEGTIMDMLLAPKVYKVEPDTFDEVVKRDKQRPKTSGPKALPADDRDGYL